MEVMITSMLKIIEEEADTFAKRAEMYYRKRPELAKWIQETYKAYRALAERYDQLSGALQKANNTIATVFPDQHFGMEDEDDDNSSEAAATNGPPSHLSPYESAKLLREQHKMDKKKVKKKRSKSSVGEAEEEIGRLQKDILVLQTEKEFIKSSYECGIANFWEKHKIITDMQERLGVLQDDLGEEVVIEDDEARDLMAVTAVKACVETLVNLYEERIKCKEEATEEYKRVKSAREKLEAIRKECGLPPSEKLDGPSLVAPTPFLTDGSMEEELGILRQQKLELESICDKVGKNFKMDPNVSVLGIADEIDEHANKVSTLETTASSQKAQVEMLRLEVDEIDEYMKSLVDGKSDVIHNSGALGDILRMAEEEMHRAEDLNKVVVDENCNLQRQLTEAQTGLSILFGRLRQKDDRKSSGMVIEEESTKGACERKELEDINSGTSQIPNSATKQGFSGVQRERNGSTEIISSSEERESKKANIEDKFRLETDASLKIQNDDHLNMYDDEDNEEGEGEDAFLVKWQKMFLDDLEDREKVMMAEYTSILQSYKEVKKKLMESDRKHQDKMLQTENKMRDLKNSNIMKDEEIRSLRQQLQFLAASWAENTDVHVAEPEVQDFVIGKSGNVSQSSSITSMNCDALVSDLSVEQDRNQLAVANGEQIFKTLHRFSSKKTTVHTGETNHATTPFEDKFRRDIDQLLEDNLGFWLRFKSSFEQMQKYREEFQELESEIMALVDQKEESAASNGGYHLKDYASRTHMILKGLQSNMSYWIEENVHMNEELHSRFSSLSNIEEEILKVAKEGGGGGINFTAYHALKFQGEVVNMRQENNHVAGELQASMDHIRSLQAKVSTLLEELDSRFELSSSKSTLGRKFSRTSSKSKVPLSAFLFGSKRRRPSIFACMHPSFQRNFSALSSGVV